MYKVRPVQTKTEQEKLCAVCGIEYNADYFAYEAVTGEEELIGMCQFSLDNEAGHIHNLVYAPDSDDFEAMYIMGRATLNFIDDILIIPDIFHTLPCTDSFPTTS